MQHDRIPDGARCLTPDQTWKKLARGKSWGWHHVKYDPDFPKPVYIGPRPVFIETHIDEWLRRKAQPSARTRRS